MIEKRGTKANCSLSVWELECGLLALCEVEAALLLGGARVS